MNLIHIMSHIDLTNTEPDAYPRPLTEEDWMKTIGFLLAAACVAATAHAQEVTLRLVSAFPENQFYVKRTVEWIDKVNKEGKGTLQINFIGGPKAIPTFEGGKAGQSGGGGIGVRNSGLFINLIPGGGIFTLSGKSA